MAKQIITSRLGDLEGLPELFRKLDKLIAVGAKVDGIKEDLIQAALPVRDEARDVVPKNTGRLRDSIYASMGDPSMPSVLVGVTYRADKSRKKIGAPHAHLIEFGTSKMRPRPYMRPAIVSARPLSARILQERITKRLADAAV